MKNKNLKKIIPLLVLVLVLGGLIAGYAVMKNANDKKAEEGETEETPVFVAFDAENAIVTALSVKGEDTDLSFSFVNESWIYDADENYPVNSDSVASMAEAVSLINATSKVLFTTARQAGRPFLSSRKKSWK